MSGVFQNIDPPTSLIARRVCTPRLWCGGRDTLAGWRGWWEENILEDVRHSSVLYVCKYFVHGADQRERRVAMSRGAGDYFYLC
jgi:hypothetical protein